jgi:hypothetical protein
MKRTIAFLAFVFAFILPAIAQTSAASALISKQELATQSSQAISKQQLASMIENARTPAEHLRIADYYRIQSQSFLTESEKHVEMGADYTRNPVKGVRGMVDHCASLAQSHKTKSRKEAELAEQHEQMARAAEQK